MASCYIIESGIPIPPRNSKKGPHQNPTMSGGYPFSSMNVGDSIFVKQEDRGSICGRSSHWGGKLGMVFTVRAVEGGCRLWRIK